MLAQTSSICLRSRKSDSLKNMLNLNANSSVNSLESSDIQWKILIYDKFGQDIISPLLNVKQLQQQGVTLHLGLHSDREVIADVPAVYFISPTKENIQRLLEDFNKGLYESYYLNFISPITRHSLEDLAQGAITANNVQQISKVVDQYDNYICLEDNLFVLQHEQSDDMSYYAINRGSSTEKEMETLVSNVVDGLFSVFVSLRQIPIIRAQRGTAAGMVAERLEKKIRDNLRDTRNSMFSTAVTGSLEQGISFSRPLLVLVDRNLDLATPLHHTWTYQALVHDVLKFSLNRVTVENSPAPATVSPATGRTRTYDLSATDSFWGNQKGSPFPVVAEAVESELDQYRSAETKLKSLKEGLEDPSEVDDVALSNTTSEITSAIDSLPELLARKQILDLHTTVATALLDHIKSRRLDQFFELEERLMSRQNLATGQDRILLDMIADPEMGNCEDKLRLFVIALICGPTVSDQEFDQYCIALQTAGCGDLSALQYVRRWLNFSSNLRAPAVSDGGGTTTKSMFSKLMQQGSTLLMEGVKNLVVKRTSLPVTRITESLMELRPTAETQDFIYLDPKLPQRVVNTEDNSRNKTPFQEAVVFMVGGGNYIEYQNLLDWQRAKSSGSSVVSSVPGALSAVGVSSSTRKSITYGCTQIYNANQFLNQLNRLGTEFN